MTKPSRQRRLVTRPGDSLPGGRSVDDRPSRSYGLGMANTGSWSGLERPAVTCTACERRFDADAIGDGVCYATLKIVEGALTREDLCVRCFESRVPRPATFWKRAVKTRGAGEPIDPSRRSRRRRGEDALCQLFDQLRMRPGGDAAPEQHPHPGERRRVAEPSELTGTGSDNAHAAQVGAREDSPTRDASEAAGTAEAVEAAGTAEAVDAAEAAKAAVPISPANSPPVDARPPSSAPVAASAAEIPATDPVASRGEDKLQYLVALALLRRRRLELVELARAEGADCLVLRQSGRAELIEIPAPPITEPELEQLMSDLQRELETA